MKVTRTFSWNRLHGGMVNIEMTLTEFRETVEWVELLSSDDGFTRDLRAELDRIDPPDTEWEVSP